MRSIWHRIRRIAWSGVSLPVKAVVDASYARSGGEYAADLEVVHRATLERTGEMLEGVPLQPIWLGADGRGLYAPPEQGRIVVVGWIEGDRGHPYVAGAAADGYTPAASAGVGEFVLVDGRGHEVRITEQFWRLVDGVGGELKLQGRWRMANPRDSLRPILESLIDAVAALTTTEGPATAVHLHAVSAPSVAALQVVRQRVGALLDV